MKNILLAITLFIGINSEARTAYDAYRMPSSGNLPSWGKIDLANGTTGNAPKATNLAGGLGGQVCYQSAADTTAFLANGTAGQILQSNGTTLAPSWVNPPTGTVTAVSVASANGFAGSSSGGATPALTLSTTATGILKGDGTAISAATSGTDYSAGTSALATGILKSTTTTGALSIAVAGDFPTLNQNTTGTASNVTGTVAIANGGTGQTTAANAINALLPTQTSNSGKYLTTNGTVASWATVSASASQEKEFHLDGVYSGLTFPLLGIDTFKVVTAAKTITSIWIWNGAAGSSGTTEYDIKMATTSGGSFTSILSTTGKITSSAAANVWTDSGSVISSQTGVTKPVIATTSIPAGAVLRFDLIQSMGGSPADCGILVEYQ